MAETGALQPALTLADSEVSIRIPQNVSLDMAPKKRSKAQLAAAERGTSTTKNKAAKKQHVDTRTTNDAEAHGVLSCTKLRPVRCGRALRVRVAHAHPLRLRLSPLARASIVLLLPIVTIVAIAISLCMRDVNRVVAGTLRGASQPSERRVGLETKRLEFVLSLLIAVY
jgi:hypothetical protein